MGILSDWAASVHESQARAKEASGKAAPYERFMAGQMRKLGECEKKRQEPAYRGKNRVEYHSEPDRTYNSVHDPREAAKKAEERWYNEQKNMDRLQNMWWWSNKNRLEYLSQMSEWLGSENFGHPHVVNLVLSAPGKENLKSNSIEFYQQIVEHYGFGGSKLPRPLTPSYIRSWIKSVPELVGQPITQSHIKIWIKSVPLLVTRPDLASKAKDNDVPVVVSNRSTEEEVLPTNSKSQIDEPKEMRQISTWMGFLIIFGMFALVGWGFSVAA